MTNMFCESAFFGVVISLLAYELGMLLKKKFGLPIFNPLLISIAVVIVFLAVFDINYQNYNDGAKYLSYLLTPATVCLAIPLYEQMEALKKNIKAILAGILSGVLTSLTVVLALALIFNLNHKMYVTLLPKSITTAIGMGVSEELGGAVTITVAVSSSRVCWEICWRRRSASCFTLRSRLQRASVSDRPPMRSVRRRPWRWAMSRAR